MARKALKVYFFLPRARPVPVKSCQRRKNRNQHKDSYHPGLNHRRPGRWVANEVNVFGGQEFVSRPGGNGEAGQVSREGALPVVGVVEGGPHSRGRARLAGEVDLR